MKKAMTLNVFLIISTVFTYSCSSLNRTQEVELKDWQAKNLVVEEKNPTTAAVLNILPGFGDFYNGNPGYGVVNLLAWPFSILWAPVGGASGAREANYYVTKANVDSLENKKKQLKGDVDMALYQNRINKDEYVAAIRKIDMMELKEFTKPIELRDIIPSTTMMDRMPTSASKK